MSTFCHSAWVTLASDSFESLVDFYRRLLSQSPQLYQQQTYAEFQLPGLRLGIFKPKADSMAEFSAGSSGGLSLCFEVIDLAAAIALLTQLGQPPPGPIINASHGQEIYAYDPAGNRLILHQSG